MSEPTQVVEAAAEHTPSLVSPDLVMLLLTWGVFISLVVILYKFAWKPILSGLDAREDSIRKSVENVDKIKAEMTLMERTVSEKLQEAGRKSQHIVDESRRAASEAAKAIHAKAREEAQITLENARREINEEKNRAKAALREESAKIAVELAGKILRENLDNDKNKRLIEGFIKEL